MTVNCCCFFNRVAGRVIRFDYTKDESHCDNDGGRETRLLAFMDDNKVHTASYELITHELSQVHSSGYTAIYLNKNEI